MIKKLILTYQYSRKLGALLLPVIATKEDKSAFYNITMILPETQETEIPGLNSHIKTMLDICHEYSEKSIFRMFSRYNQAQSTFYQFLKKKYLEEHIRPYIDKRIINVLQIAYSQNIEIYHKHSQNLLEADRLTITDEPLNCQFHFSYDQNQLEYDLQLSYKNKPVDVRNQRIFILCENPSAFILNGHIYFIDDFNTKKIIPFVNKDKIIVPARLVDQYLDTFVRNAIKSHNVTSDGITIHEPEIKQKATLKLEPSLQNQLSLNLRFQYNHLSVRPDQSVKQALVELHPETKSFTKIQRDTAWEAEKADYIKQLGLIKRSGTIYTLPDQINEYALIEWINQNKDNLENNGFEIFNNTDKNFLLKQIQLKFKTKIKNDWFDLYGLVKLGDFELPFAQLKNHILKGIREYKLPDGSIAILPEAWFNDYRELFGLGEKQGDIIRLKKYQYEALPEHKTNIRQKLSEKYKALKSNGVNYEIPAEIEATLRNYQTEGYNWMRKLREFQFGGCLADDMGLGKTLQTLTLLTYHHLHGNNIDKTHKTETTTYHYQQLDLFSEQLNSLKKNSTSLIITPASITHNWINESAKFAPALKIKNHTGPNRTQNFDNFHYYDLIFTSYGIVRNEAEQLKDYCFDYIVIDESQHIKNPDSVIYKAVSKLTATNKLVLTGTPIENSLADLWAQLDFINPGIAGSRRWFKNYYVLPIEKNQDQQRLQKLKTLTAPFILRRTKAEVTEDLPPLTEQTILCEMTEEQAEVYNERKSATRNALLKLINEHQMRKNTTFVLKALSELRQLANNPLMLDSAYQHGSGKTEIISRHLENLVAEQHKVIVFSSYVKHLNIIRDICNQKAWKYSTLTGETKNREEAIARFQEDDEYLIFLVSLKAGGVGLNLTAAEYVMMLDPWWNPAAEYQAINRAHRIGQDKNVMVYRYISRDTIEEKIRNLQHKKQKLSDELIDDSLALKNMSDKEIEALFN